MIDKLRLDLVQLYSQGKVNLVTFKKINEIIENLDSIEGIGDLTALTQRVNQLENTTEQLKNLAENLSDRLFALESNLALQIESIVDEKIGTLNEDVSALNTQYVTLATRTNKIIGLMEGDYNSNVIYTTANESINEILTTDKDTPAYYEGYARNATAVIEFTILDGQSWSIESGTLTRYTQGQTVQLNSSFSRWHAMGWSFDKRVFIIENVSINLSNFQSTYTYHYIVTNDIKIDISMTWIPIKYGVTV